VIGISRPFRANGVFQRYPLDYCAPLGLIRVEILLADSQQVLGGFRVHRFLTTKSAVELCLQKSPLTVGTCGTRSLKKVSGSFPRGPICPKCRAHS